MSRESDRDRERLERQAEQAGGEGGGAAPAAGREGRASPGQYIGEVRSELSRVHWPDRKQLGQYSVAVLIAVSLMTIYIFGIDQVFAQVVLWMFG